MTEILPQTATLFDTLRRERPDGSEYWSARDLMASLGYQRWENAQAAITRAIEACEESGIPSETHFRATTKKVSLGGKAQRDVLDYHLSRYAAYLTAINSDPAKAQVALAQTYFAVQTRKAEVGKTVASAIPADPMLAQLQMMIQLREEQLELKSEVTAIRQRLNDAPISSAQVGAIHRLGKQLGRVIGYAKAWRMFKDRFQLASYRDLPASQFDEGVEFLKAQLRAWDGAPLIGAEG